MYLGILILVFFVIHPTKNSQKTKNPFLTFLKFLKMFRLLQTTNQERNMTRFLLFFFFFFKLPFPFFAIRLLRYLSVGRFSNSFSLFLCLSVMRRGSGALSPATHAHSTSHSQTYATTFIHPWAPFPTGLEPVLTSRWWPKEC
jgi:hypothetical protein